MLNEDCQRRCPALMAKLTVRGSDVCSPMILVPKYNLFEILEISSNPKHTKLFVSYQRLLTKSLRFFIYHSIMFQNTIVEFENN